MNSVILYFNHSLYSIIFYSSFILLSLSAYLYLYIFVIPVPFFFCACEIGCFCPFFLLELSVPLFLFHSLPSPSIHFRFESFNRISVHLRLVAFVGFGWFGSFVRSVRLSVLVPFRRFCSALFSISVLFTSIPFPFRNSKTSSHFALCSVQPFVLLFSSFHFVVLQFHFQSFCVPFGILNSKLIITFSLSVVPFRCGVWFLVLLFYLFFSSLQFHLFHSVLSQIGIFKVQSQSLLQQGSFFIFSILFSSVLCK